MKTLFTMTQLRQNLENGRRAERPWQYKQSTDWSCCAFMEETSCAHVCEINFRTFPKRASQGHRFPEEPLRGLGPISAPLPLPSTDTQRTSAYIISLAHSLLHRLNLVLGGGVLGKGEVDGWRVEFCFMSRCVYLAQTRLGARCSLARKGCSKQLSGSAGLDLAKLQGHQRG